MSLSVRMVGKKLLIEPNKLNEKTEGGILIPEPARSSSVIVGRVFARGDDVLPEIGDEVLYDSSVGVKVKVDGKNLDLVSENQVHAILFNTQLEVATK